MVILITGGTGSLGSKIVERLFAMTSHEIIVLSRDEQKQFTQRLKYQNNLSSKAAHRINYVLGDIRDKNVVDRIFYRYKPSIVIHTAALKHIRVCDENPSQAVQTNIIGTENLTDAVIEHDAVMCHVSTDKAVAPTTLYGMTKSIVEKHINNLAITHRANFCGARYGNVLNSKGSLIPLFQQISKLANPVFNVTHAEMTRFFISLEDAASLIFKTLFEHYKLMNSTDPNMLFPPQLFENIEIWGYDGVFTIPKILSASILTIAEIFAENCNTQAAVEILSPYPTEKLHEEMAPGYSSKDFVMTKEETWRMLMTEKLL